MGFLEEVVEAVGHTMVVTDPDLVAPFGTDWTRRWSLPPSAVLHPRTVDHVASIVAAARRHGVGLVPQGGNTGLVGGGVPRPGADVVVDLRGLDAIGPVDELSGQVTAGAGVTLAALQAHVGAAGLELPVDLGSRESATVGGMVATNAGGLHVVRHGTMRAHVLGIEAVLGTGDVVVANLGGLVKDNTGYDLPGLLCGSEGTLGLVTAVRLRLVERATDRAVALLGLDDTAAALDLLPLVRLLPSLAAVEVMRAADLRLVAHHLATPVPLDPLPACAVLVELAGDGELVAELGALFDAAGTAIRSSAVAVDPLDRARLWRWREAHPEAAAALGLVHKADVSVPVGALAAFIDEVEPTVHAVAPAATVLVYGHLGDGNLHVNVVGPEAGDEHVLEAVFELVLAHGGSVSAEHGIGVAKPAWMVRQTVRRAWRRCEP
jgi:FAD/FMN-containing dehydrogenase